MHPLLLQLRKALLSLITGCFYFAFFLFFYQPFSRAEILDHNLILFPLDVLGEMVLALIQFKWGIALLLLLLLVLSLAAAFGVFFGIFLFWVLPRDWNWTWARGRLRVYSDLNQLLKKLQSGELTPTGLCRGLPDTITEESVPIHTVDWRHRGEWVRFVDLTPGNWLTEHFQFTPEKPGWPPSSRLA
jgi:hypothetical protein